MTALIDRVTEAYAETGATVPQWVSDLARECAATSQNKVAVRMNRSAAMISQVLNAKYPGDLAAVEEVFKGVFQQAVIDCPALSKIPANVCRDWRNKSHRFVSVNSLRVRMFRACNACPRNKKDVR